MPKITDARRELRREQITRAAIRCFVHNGMERTSIADITTASGLSAGSIYSHYRNKAELVQAVAHELLERRVSTLTGYATSSNPPSPAELLARLADGIDPDEARVGVQAWGEATTDPAIREIVVAMTDRMRDLLRVTCEAWLSKTEGPDASEVPARAAVLAAQVMAAYQALIIRSAFGLVDPADQAAITKSVD
ncbi:TetR/AcrR family transcriptional regulator [Micromonosporaceae bacterium Da 78-11]